MKMLMQVWNVSFDLFTKLEVALLAGGVTGADEARGRNRQA